MIRYKKNPRAGAAEVTVDGVRYAAKYIGKGQYSRVFRVGDRVIYYTKGDCSKEVLAMYMYDKMTHLPDLVRHENITMTSGMTWYVFSAPYYRNVTTKDRSAWELMKKILRMYTGAFHIAYSVEGYRGYELMARIVNIMRSHKVLPNSVINALQEILEISGNCGAGVAFDLHNKNFGVNEYGTLIFRDPVYVKE